MDERSDFASPERPACPQQPAAQPARQASTRSSAFTVPGRARDSRPHSLKRTRFPARARAAPGATIYANNRRIVPRFRARACRPKDSMRIGLCGEGSTCVPPHFCYSPLSAASQSASLKPAQTRSSSPSRTTSNGRFTSMPFVASNASASSSGKPASSCAFTPSSR